MPSVPGHPLLRTVSGDPMGDMLRTVAGNPMGNIALSVAGNPLGGDEAVKGYQHYLTGGGAPYTEQNLSDAGYRDLMQAAYKALSDPYRNKHPDQGGLSYGDYPDSSSKVDSLIGQTSSAGLRHVSVNGVPYLQVRDIYKFNNDPYLTEAGPVTPVVVGRAIFGSRGDQQHIGVVAAQHVGTPYPVNMLFPENPANVAPTNALNDFRNKTTYAITPQGGVVQNNAVTYGGMYGP